MSEKSKSSLKMLIQGFIEDTIVSSSFINKIIMNITLVALESKKIADAILTLNDRLNIHEDLILKLAQTQYSNVKDAKDKETTSLTTVIVVPKQKPSKPN